MPAPSDRGPFYWLGVLVCGANLAVVVLVVRGCSG
jgi:hypothetical protein